MIATFPTMNIDIEEYPAVKRFLLDFGKDRLRQEGKKLSDGTTSRKKTGNKWYETQDQISYYPEFEREKVIYPDIAQRLTFTLDNENWFLANTAYFITGQHLKYLTGILNSKVLDWFYRLISAQLGEKGTRHFSIYIEQLPIPKVTVDSERAVGELVDTILTITKGDDYADNSAKQGQVGECERQIDRLVYQLYGLTEGEVGIVEGA